MSRTPNYRLVLPFIVSGDRLADQRTLPAGSFVRPIDWYWLPQHVKDRHKFYDKNNEVLCYTKYGIYPIPKNYLEET